MSINLKTEQGFIVKPATELDAEAIYQLATQLQFDSVSDKPQGFLVFVPDQKAYAQKLEKASVSLVAYKDQTLAGYLIAYTKANIISAGKQSEPEIQRIERCIDSDYIYIEQVAVNKDYWHKGVAQLLLDNVVKQKPGMTLAAAIVEGPTLNTASMSFFTKNKFQKAGEIKRNDWLAGIYLKNLDIAE